LRVKRCRVWQNVTSVSRTQHRRRTPAVQYVTLHQSQFTASSGLNISSSTMFSLCCIANDLSTLYLCILWMNAVVCGFYWPDNIPCMPTLWQVGGDGWTFTSVVLQIGSRTQRHWWIFKHHRCVSTLRPIPKILHLFRASACLYRHCLMGSSQQQRQQQQQLEVSSSKICIYHHAGCCLPRTVTDSNSLGTFKSRLKTLLYSQAYNGYWHCLPPVPLKLRPNGAIQIYYYYYNIIVIIIKRRCINVTDSQYLPSFVFQSCIIFKAASCSVASHQLSCWLSSCCWSFFVAGLILWNSLMRHFCYSVHTTFAFGFLL